MWASTLIHCSHLEVCGVLLCCDLGGDDFSIAFWATSTWEQLLLIDIAIVVLLELLGLLIWGRLLGTLLRPN